MPRIIVFLVTIAALAILALQNLATEVPLVILGKTFVAAIPLGLLLVMTVGLGALLTLIFYGLVGSRRLPESKYRPMGRRVPYPEGPSTRSSPAVGSATDDASFSESSPSQGYGRSSAFVSEPEPASQPFVSPPQDRPVQDTPPSWPMTPDTSSSEPPSGSVAQDSVSEPPSASSSFVQQPMTGLKSVFGKKKRS